MLQKYDLDNTFRSLIDSCPRDGQLIEVIIDFNNAPFLVLGRKFKKKNIVQTFAKFGSYDKKNKKFNLTVFGHKNIKLSDSLFITLTGKEGFLIAWKQHF